MDQQTFMEIATAVTKLKMYPYFDVANYALMCMMVREDNPPQQPGIYHLRFLHQCRASPFCSGPSCQLKMNECALFRQAYFQKNTTVIYIYFFWFRQKFIIATWYDLHGPSAMFWQCIIAYHYQFTKVHAIIAWTFVWTGSGLMDRSWFTWLSLHAPHLCMGLQSRAVKMAFIVRACMHLLWGGVNVILKNDISQFPKNNYHYCQNPRRLIL